MFRTRSCSKHNLYVFVSCTEAKHKDNVVAQRSASEERQVIGQTPYRIA